MIKDYFRPQTLEDALRLLAQPNTIPLGGGTWINQPHAETISVVDLQNLGLTHTHKHGNNLEMDACVTLQQLHDSPHCPDALKQAIRLESPLNVRNAATLAGTLVTCGGRSTFATAMLALDAKISVNTDPKNVETISLGEYLSLRSLPGKLITKISIPLNVTLSFESVAKTPADTPIVCAAACRWASGRTRLALGGYGQAPTLAMDGTEADGIETAAHSAYHEAGDDIASAEYRADIAATLAKRCLA